VRSAGFFVLFFVVSRRHLSVIKNEPSNLLVQFLGLTHADKPDDGQHGGESAPRAKIRRTNTMDGAGGARAAASPNQMDTDEM
jgi:hypothetical protein